MANLLSQLSDDIAGVVDSVGASVVRVDGRRRFSATGIVWSADGTIVTANHTITRIENLTVGLPNGETVAAEVVGFDPTTDILVLRAAADGLTVPTFAEPGNEKVGHLVTALGRPRRSVQASLGIISARGPEWQTRAGGRIDAWINTDVVMYPGFSGGPLVAPDGSVIGMMTSAFRGASVALPVPTLRRVVGALLSHGRVERPYLGVAAQVVRLPEALAQEVGHRRGLLVSSVESGSAAEAAGLYIGDILISLGERPLRRSDDLLAALGDYAVGDTATIQFARGGVLETRDVTLGERDRSTEQ